VRDLRNFGTPFVHLEIAVYLSGARGFAKFTLLSKCKELIDEGKNNNICSLYSTIIDLKVYQRMYFWYYLPPCSRMGAKLDSWFWSL
jgi:hypothetical protein